MEMCLENSQQLGADEGAVGKIIEEGNKLKLEQRLEINEPKRPFDGWPGGEIGTN